MELQKQISYIQELLAHENKILDEEIMKFYEQNRDSVPSPLKWDALKKEVEPTIDLILILKLKIVAAQRVKGSEHFNK